MTNGEGFSRLEARVEPTESSASTSQVVCHDANPDWRRGAQPQDIGGKDRAGGLTPNWWQTAFQPEQIFCSNSVAAAFGHRFRLGCGRISLNPALAGARESHESDEFKALHHLTPGPKACRSGEDGQGCKSFSIRAIRVIRGLNGLFSPNSEMGTPFFVAQVSEPAVSPTSQSAGPRRFGASGTVPAFAGWETRDTAGWEACATFAWPAAPIPVSEIGCSVVKPLTRPRIWLAVFAGIARICAPHHAGGVNAHERVAHGTTSSFWQASTGCRG